MPAPLVRPVVTSIYKRAGKLVRLPERMAHCSPDTRKAMYGIRRTLENHGGAFLVSDLFRSYDMQRQAHRDYMTGRKTGFSPPPGGSMHEAGRAFDVDLNAVRMSLAEFWKIAAQWRVVPIIGMPDPTQSQSWHFECRGSHQLVYDYYAARKGSNFLKPSQAMAASAIVSIGVSHDAFPGRGAAAYLQSALIRLGLEIGSMDGDVGTKTRSALQAAGVAADTIDAQLSAVEGLLGRRFPEEYSDA